MSGLAGLSAGDPLMIRDRQGRWRRQTVAKVARIWLYDNHANAFRIEDGTGAGDFGGRAYTERQAEVIQETEQLTRKLVSCGWVPVRGKALTLEQLRMAAQLLERFERMNDPDLPEYLRDSAFGRTGAAMVEDERPIPARRRGSAAETAEDLAQALRDGSVKADELLSMVETLRYYLTELQGLRT